MKNSTKGSDNRFRSIHFRLVAGEAGAVVALQSELEPRDTQKKKGEKKSFPHFLLVSFWKERGEKANGEPHK